MKVAFLFPGQGSQFVGMGKELYEEFASVRDLFAQAADILGMDIAALCFEGPESTLIQTRNVQPAVTVVNIACYQVAGARGIAPAAAAGHSLGEYAALHAAGVLSLADTLKVVQSRGIFMQEAAEAHPGGMMAVMGLSVERFDDICERASSAGSVEVANHNSRSQVILTGEPDALELAGKLAKEAGAVYMVPLKVSGPWHSRFMRTAGDRLAEVLANCEVNAPRLPVVSNVTGEFHGEPSAIRESLVRQVASPVRWVDCVERLTADGSEAFLELGPGTMLAGLIRDIDKTVKVASVGDVETLKALESWLPARPPPGD